MTSQKAAASMILKQLLSLHTSTIFFFIVVVPKRKLLYSIVKKKARTPSRETVMLALHRHSDSKDITPVKNVGTPGIRSYFKVQLDERHRNDSSSYDDKVLKQGHSWSRSKEVRGLGEGELNVMRSLYFIRVMSQRNI